VSELDVLMAHSSFFSGRMVEVLATIAKSVRQHGTADVNHAVEEQLLHLIMPRSAASTNRISISTSSPRSSSDFSFSSACEVFIFEASRIL
jgi:hypothetical protein